MFKLIGAVIGGGLVMYWLINPLHEDRSHRILAVTQTALGSIAARVVERVDQVAVTMQTGEQDGNQASVGGAMGQDEAEESVITAADNGGNRVVGPEEGPAETGREDGTGILSLDSGFSAEGTAGQAPPGPRYWHTIWGTFGSEAAAQGFATRLAKVTGLSLEVMQEWHGQYMVAISYITEEDLGLALDIIRQKTGLKVAGLEP